jgi:branched-chain amino acid transport system permease protein
MSDFLQLVTAGISIGAIYALIAIGFVAIFTVSGVINLAQGDLAAMSGLVAISAVASGMPIVVAAAVAILLVALVSVGIERLAIAPIRSMTTLTSIIVTLGVSIALKATLLLIWGPDARSLDPLPGSDINVGGVSIRAQELWIIGIALVVAIAVSAFYEGTLLGKALRACAEQPTAARLVGISPKRATLLAFLVAGLVSAIAGILVSPIAQSSWESGLTIGLKGFVAAALAGLVSVRGAVAGGILLGVIESLVAGYLDSGLRDAVAFGVLIVLLVVRPAGVFSRHAVARV